MTLSALIARVEEGTDRDRILDRDIWVAMGSTFEKRDRDRKPWLYLPANKNGYSYRKDPDDGVGWALGKMDLTASLDAVLSLIEQKLPGFWWRGGTCSVSSEARVCPDHNCPEHGARLLAECPPSLDIWNEGIEVELRPGSQNALVRALLAATLRALSALGDSKADLADATNGDHP